MRHVAVILALAALALPRPALALALVRAPYLQKGTPNSVTVVWRTDTAANARVRYGSAPDALTQTVSIDTAKTQHEVTLSGLAPGTRYYYSVGSSTTVLAGGDEGHSFVTAPPVGTPARVRFWVVGDSGTGDSNQRAVRDAMLDATVDERPQLFVHVGDMAYDAGTTTEFTTNFFTPYQAVMRGAVTWPAIGNHEGTSSNSSTQSGPYYDAYVLPTAAEAGGLASGTEAYYSFDHANIHFIVLDSHETPRGVGDAMLTWMADDLAATDQDWIVAFWHHPPYSKGTHDSDDESQLIDMRENALPILEAAGVDLVLAGHSHIYERSFLVHGFYDVSTVASGTMLDDGDGKLLGEGPYLKPTGETDGAVYVVAGHGGAGLGGTADHPLMFKSEKVHGSCIVDVQGNTLTLTNLRKDGVRSDGFTLVKGSALVLVDPDGSEPLLVGSTHEVRWLSVAAAPASLALEARCDGDVDWQPVATGLANTGSYLWTVPGTPRQNCRLRLTGGGLTDESDAPFDLVTSRTYSAIDYGGRWRYDDDGPGYGDEWLALDFDDSDWPEGNGDLGYGDGGEDTLLYDANPNIPTVYFRQVVTLPGNVTAATLKVLYDDAVAVWVNGELVLSKRMEDGTDYGIWAASTSAEDEEVLVGLSFAAGNPFVVGENIIAAMVKQRSFDSTDLSFDLELRITAEAVASNWPPVITPIGAQTVQVGEQVSFLVPASDLDEDPLAFSATGMPAGATLNANTGAFAWIPTLAQVGTHIVVFSADDGHGGVDSASAVLHVAAPPDGGEDDGGPPGGEDDGGPSDDERPDDSKDGEPAGRCGCAPRGGSGDAAPLGTLLVLFLAWRWRIRRRA